MILIPIVICEVLFVYCKQKGRGHGTICVNDEVLSGNGAKNSSMAEKMCVYRVDGVTRENNKSVR